MGSSEFSISNRGRLSRGDQAKERVAYPWWYDIFPKIVDELNKNGLQNIAGTVVCGLIRAFTQRIL